MPGLAAFRLPNKHSSRVGIEIARAKAGELAIFASSEKCRLDQIPEIALGSINQPPDFILGEVSQARCVDLPKRFDCTPRDIGIDLAITKCLVKRGPQDG